MTKREAWLVVLLTLLTCGFYQLYWLFVTTDELKQVSGRDDLSPAMDLVIGFFTCGLWTIYVMYRNAQIVHECFLRQSARHDDKSTMILFLYVIAVFNGFTALIAPAILQDEYNRLANLGAAGHSPVTF